MDILDVILINQQSQSSYPLLPSQFASPNHKSYVLVELNDYYTYGICHLQRYFSNNSIKYIKRVINPFQLALFDIQTAKRKSEGDPISKVEGYHPILSLDLETALQNTLDYRRYKSNVAIQSDKHPILYKDVDSAKKKFDAYSQSSFDKIIIVCDVLTDNSGNFDIRFQSDYYIKYVVCFT